MRENDRPVVFPARGLCTQTVDKRGCDIVVLSLQSLADPEQGDVRSQRRRLSEQIRHLIIEIGIVPMPEQIIQPGALVVEILWFGGSCPVQDVLCFVKAVQLQQNQEIVVTHLLGIVFQSQAIFLLR